MDGPLREADSEFTTEARRHGENQRNERGAAKSLPPFAVEEAHFMNRTHRCQTNLDRAR